MSYSCLTFTYLTCRTALSETQQNAKTTRPSFYLRPFTHHALTPTPQPPRDLPLTSPQRPPPPIPLPSPTRSHRFKPPKPVGDIADAKAEPASDLVPG
ncbi:hypothetical protein AOQ84DRAFT_59264 [Glonium stellatum]|uniref:Uncharacterized protein n=1 Tax=Glonium stellatum TaxID=574774 RepID=A0A8E2EYT2_9PEZI|nr:hypothetical protein AOQ84DRAFT_59264 [Glonium stellatum]